MCWNNRAMSNLQYMNLGPAPRSLSAPVWQEAFARSQRSKEMSAALVSRLVGELLDGQSLEVLAAINALGPTIDAVLDAKNAAALRALRNIALLEVEFRNRARTDRDRYISQGPGIISSLLEFVAVVLPLIEDAPELLTTPLTRPEHIPVTPAKGKTRAGPLTVRELDVLALAAEGFTNQEIGVRLFITEGTVKKHLTNIFTKLGASNRAQAVLFACRLGLFT